MKHLLWTATCLAAAALVAGRADASGVGLTQHHPTGIVPAGHAYPSGDCGPGGACSGGAARGFPSVDGALPPPCSADGICYPKPETFGFHRTRWRRWPGDEATGPAPTPAEATEGDELLQPFDTPAPELEDQQAPPPIEDDPGAESDEPDDELPPLEIDLPPLPDRPPLNQPFAPPPPADEDGPPGLPFGMNSAAGPTIGWRTRGDTGEPADRDATPLLPDFPEEAPPRGERVESARLPRPAGDAPPALPNGFTLLKSPINLDEGRDLPAMPPSGLRLDRAVRQASAVGPRR